MNNPNRTKNKLRKIYSCLGFNCDSNKTNGMMIDELEHKAECGELGGGGVNTATCTLTVGTGYYQTNIDKEDFDDGSNDSLYGGWKLNSVSGSSGFFDYKENAEITTNDSRISALFNGDSLSIEHEPSVSIEEGTIVTVTIKWTEASANLTAEELTAKEIRTSVESGQAITPPEGYDGFSEVTFPSYLLQEKVVTNNETMEFGTDSTPYFPKKLTVNVPSNYTVEVLDVGKNSDPVTISYEGKTFVFLGMVNGSGTFTGLGGAESNLANAGSVSISSAGSTAGTVSSDPNTKTITYTPNTSFQMGPVRITKVII